MVRFSLKLAVLVMGTLAVAGYLSWTRDFVTPYSNPQVPLRNNIEAEKRETQDGTAKNVKELKAEEKQLNQKIALDVDKTAQQKDNNLPQTEGSQEDSNQRTDNKDNEAPQLNEQRDHEENDHAKEEETVKVDSQGKNHSIQEEAAKHHGRIPTFFSTLPSSFSGIWTAEGNEIPTKEFLKAGHDLTPFLDKFGRTTMNLAHQDLSGNAQKIYAVYESDPEVFKTLQQMVLHELDKGEYNVDGKGTVSLLWLKRGFKFLAEFLHRLADGEEPSDAADAAYDNHLYQHHNFFLRGTFKFAFRTLPYRTDFFKKLAVNEEDTSLPQFDQTVAEDMANYTKGLEQALQILTDFYASHDLPN